MRLQIRVPGFRNVIVPPGFILMYYADVIQSDAVRNLPA